MPGALFRGKGLPGWNPAGNSLREEDEEIVPLRYRERNVCRNGTGDIAKIDGASTNSFGSG
jgi:hypothetical protein